MMSENQVCILGSGTSTGVPMPGCNCQVCTSTLKENKRTRTSILIRTSDKKTIIVDTTPDFRTQVLRENVQDVDAVIITHDHADHLHGIDDLRPFCFKRTENIPVYTHPECAEVMKTRFPYIFKREEVFKDKPVLGGGIPMLDLKVVESEAFICGLEFKFYLLPHGHTKTLGFICGNFAYFVDCLTLPKEAIEEMQKRKLEVLILDCVKREYHNTHLNLERSLKFAQEIGAKKTGLIHMGHELEHKALCLELKAAGHPHISPVYDGENFLFHS